MQPSWGPRIFWSCVFLLLVAGVFAWFYEPGSNSESDQVRESSVRENQVTISPQLFGCELQIGLRDQAPTHWKGEIRLSKGKLLQVVPLRSGKGASTQGGQFEVSSFPDEHQTARAILRCAFLPEASDSLLVLLGNERKTVALSELLNEKSVDLFDGRVKLSRAPPIQALHQSEDDALLPNITTDRQGNAHLIYLNCERRQLDDAPAILSGNFDTLLHSSGGVSVRLCHFQKGTWSGAEDVTGTLDAVSDVAVATDPEGRVYVAWSQPGSDGFDIYYRTKAYNTQGNAENAWSESKRVTEHSGSVRDLVAATDAKGKVWLAWQTWHYDHYDIYASVINDEAHAWHMPGPVADHDRDSEGRWYPSIASDQSGNVYIAWSIFRQGNFNVELVKLAANAAKAQPVLITESLPHATRVAMMGDAQNRLWIACEDSGAQIRVRLMDSQQHLSDLPAIPLPPSLKRSKQTENQRKTEENGISPSGSSISSPLPPVCFSQPHLLMLPADVPLMAFGDQEKLYYTAYRQQGWSEPEELMPISGNSRTIVTLQADCVVAYGAGSDEMARSRIYVSAQPVPSADKKEDTRRETEARIGNETNSPSSLDSALSRPHPGLDWKRFQENARLFRQRPQDSQLGNKHLLRGLVVLPSSFRNSKFEIRDSIAQCTLPAIFEQLMCDWAWLPPAADEPASWHWISQLQNQAFSQKSERLLLSGYYRSSPQEKGARGQGGRDTLPLAPDSSPLSRVSLIVQNRLDHAPLPTQERLYSFLPGSALPPTAKDVDARLMERYLAGHKEFGFTLTEDWRALAAFSPPTARSIDGSEDGLMPFWYQPGLDAMRIVAYADGKSQEHLLDALRNRHFYFATDDIYLLARCDKRVPGEVFQTALPPVITVQAQGTGKLAKVEIWRDAKLIMSEEPPGAAAVLECPDLDIDRAWHHYTVRILQADGAMAITQPFWIRYQP
jgi:hypothetical protein